MKRYRSWWLTLIPIGAAVAIVVWMKWAYPVFPVIQLRIDLASLLLIGGAAVSIWILILLTIRRYITRVRDDTVSVTTQNQRQFLERLDHELKNPLSIIRAGLALLDSDIRNVLPNNLGNGQDHNEFQVSHFQETISKINFQIQRLVRLITDLRKLSDIEVRSLELSQVNVDNLLRQLVDETKLDPGCKDCEIRLSVPTAPWRLPEIRADEDLIYLSLHNLLDNAVKYSRPGDTVEVRAYENHHELLIEIADKGVGIPEQEIDKIWGELYRAKNARRIPGTGLGLPIVRAIIRRHQGNISVRSRESVGTIFTVRLPV